MLPGRVSNPGPLTYESGALPIALRGPARGERAVTVRAIEVLLYNINESIHSPETPKTRYGNIQIIRMDKSTGQKRVKKAITTNILVY